MNAVAFSFDDYEELNHDQLIEVNGGCGGGFWSGVKNFFSGGKSSSSSSSGSSSGSGSSSSSSSSTTTSSSNGGCGGSSSSSSSSITTSSSNGGCGGSNSTSTNNSGSLNGTTQGFIDNMTELAGGYYVYGGNDPDTDGGLDCSGSVLYGLNQEGNNIPDQTANDIMNNTDIVTPVDASDVQPGDLRFLVDENGYANHVQVILGEDGSRFNATGGPENDINNPGTLDILTTELPQSGVYRRPNFEN